jgi:hypothetical protein
MGRWRIVWRVRLLRRWEICDIHNSNEFSNFDCLVVRRLDC